MLFLFFWFLRDPLCGVYYPQFFNPEQTSLRVNSDFSTPDEEVASANCLSEKIEKIVSTDRRIEGTLEVEEVISFSFSFSFHFLCSI